MFKISNVRVAMRIQWLLGLLVGVGCIGGVSLQASAQSDRLWTPADSVALRHFLYDLNQGEPLSGDLRRDTHMPASLSPDGQHFFFVSFSGDLERDESVGQISVFSVPAVSTALREGRSSADRCA